ncbi:hypothetical protein Desti_3712 [Desulfomonile tiedjei DSM 6799]|uniref:Uncharacterized protein n=1 Tax=Desulfomonile tiedjei (strain ATCC 49306 / DSM 6799 / DCB-1) TaxID=706587 RepID=I4C9W6_DESTA|nr:hypothetical protein Desti_3712 [Desulfomonile tiedjei DSM 6799]
MAQCEEELQYKPYLPKKNNTWRLRGTDRTNSVFFHMDLHVGALESPQKTKKDEISV